MSQLEIKDKAGHIYHYASIHEGDLRLEYEIYGHGAGSADSECIYTVSPSEFAKIGEKYGIKGDTDILSILENVVRTNRAREFDHDLKSGFIVIKDKFVWTSFND